MPFTTPAEMFKEYQMETHAIYMSYSDKRDREACQLMDEYELEAKQKIQLYVECIAEAYVDGCKRSTKIWEDKGLRLIHAYAVLDEFNQFVDEFEENERPEPDYDV